MGRVQIKLKRSQFLSHLKFKDTPLPVEADAPLPAELNHAQPLIEGYIAAGRAQIKLKVSQFLPM
jgi:hypothetical protein